MKNDFLLVNHGSILILTPLTKAAKQWRDEHLPDDAQSWCRGVVIEPRYVSDIVDGITADGLTVAT